MIKLFFITFFIAELIIALAVILSIYKFNKRVNELNKAICASKSLIGEIIADIRELIMAFNDKFQEVKDLIKRKKEEYILNTAKNVLIYTSILFLRGKYKKTVLAYQLASEIYDGLKEDVWWMST